MKGRMSMNSSLTNIRLPAGSVILAIAVGFAFGAIQSAALARHRNLQKRGKLNSAWTIAPGAMRRTGFFLLALAVIQVACPIFFTDGRVLPWMVSAGVVVGYGWTLLQQLRHRSSPGA